MGENHQQYTTLITDDYRAEFLSWSSYNDSCVQAVYGCSVMAKLQNYPVFGIEFAGECYGSLGLDYFVDSESTTCVHGVGLYGFEVYWYEILWFKEQNMDLHRFCFMNMFLLKPLVQHHTYYWNYIFHILFINDSMLL